MAKLSRKKGTTSQIFHIFIMDSSSTVGAGLTGLAFNSASLACRYINAGGTLSGAITLQDVTTLGTYEAPSANTNMRFKEVSSASPSQGVYEIHLHNDWMNLTGGSLVIMLAGATNMAQFRLEIDLQADTNVTHLLGTLIPTPTVAGVPNVNAKTWNDLTTVALPATPTNITAGTITTATNVTTVNGLAANVVTAAAIANDALDALTFTPCIGTGTCAAGGNTTTIIASAIVPSSIVNDQFKGRIIIFDRATTTTALRGQATDITAYTHATLTFTVTALTTNPANLDTFHIL